MATAAEAVATQPVRMVHVVFKTHLDIGFTDLGRKVEARYIEHFIPRALDLADAMRADGSDRFIWTTGSWMIHEYLERSNTQSRRRMEEAIAAGDIAWHGLPFTTHSELADAPLFRYGLSLARNLDRRFGKQTIAAKMTDVPGHTRGIVPLLAEAGIQFLHIGVNPASTPPDVPPVFLWRDPSGADLVVMYNRGSYGDLMVVPGLDEAIMISSTDDNAGPQSPEAVRALLASMRARFPGAHVMASTLDAFARALPRVRATLPIVTEEIGDTWIHGVGSDPGKVARFRELLRLRRAWLDGIPSAKLGARFDAFSHALLQVPEHSWGLDEKTHLHDETHYTPAQLQSMRGDPRFKAMEESWAEKRGYVETAVAALGDSDLAAEARDRLSAIVPSRPTRAGTAAIDAGVEIRSARLAVRIDAQTGALIGLRDLANGRDWASPDHPLALIGYQTFDADDYARFWRQYIINKRDPTVRPWAIQDYTKPGMASAGTRRGMWNAVLTGLRQRSDEFGDHIIAELRGEEEAVERYGCPRIFTLEYTLPRHESAVQVTLQWFEKRANRLPEALWLSWRPRLSRPEGWRIEKLGEWISPLEVVRNGNRRLHATGAGMRYSGHEGGLWLETFDAALVAPGEPSLLNFTNRQPPLRGGMHVNLYNNIWGTNFPMWYGEDARFRFRLVLSESAG